MELALEIKPILGLTTTDYALIMVLIILQASALAQHDQINKANILH
jgi:hypothetical protein